MKILTAAETADRMKIACERFLESFTPELFRKVLFDFEPEEEILFLD